MNKFGININPAPGIGTEEWYLSCIRDLVHELRRFEEVEVYGKERLAMLNDKQLKERIEVAIEWRNQALEITGQKLAECDDYTYEEYKRDLAEIDRTYSTWINSIHRQ